MDGGNGSSPNGTDNVPATSAEPTFWQKARKYWSYVSIEPVAVCWILPSCLGLIAIQNLELEKVELQYVDIMLNIKKLLCTIGMSSEF